MKSLFTKNYIFINPSTNLCKLSLRLENLGANVRRVYAKRDIKVLANRVVYRNEDDYSILKFDTTPHMLPEIFLKVKNNFINRYRYKRYLRKIRIDNTIEYVLQNKFPLTEPYFSTNCETVDSISHLVKDSKSTFIIASYLDTRDFPDIHPNKEVAVFEIDNEICKYFRNDYNIIKEKGIYLEFFLSSGMLYFISDSYESIEKAISRTFLGRINANLVERYGIRRNYLSYYIKVKKNVMLMNDYSFFNLSLNPGAFWFKKMGDLLCTEKV